MKLRVLRLRLPIRQLQSLTTKPERSWASPEITKEQWGVRQCLWASEGKLSQQTHKFEEIPRVARQQHPPRPQTKTPPSRKTANPGKSAKKKAAGSRMHLHTNLRTPASPLEAGRQIRKKDSRLGTENQNRNREKQLHYTRLTLGALAST